MASSSTAKRPRLSLQTKPASGPTARNVRGSSLGKTDPRSPTSFNTLSNVYVTEIERSTPVQSTPLTAINLSQALKLQTEPDNAKDPHQRIQTPFTATYPDTPLTANPMSPTIPMEMAFPSAMTAPRRYRQAPWTRQDPRYLGPSGSVVAEPEPTENAYGLARVWSEGPIYTPTWNPQYIAQLTTTSLECANTYLAETAVTPVTGESGPPRGLRKPTYTNDYDGEVYQVPHRPACGGGIPLFGISYRRGCGDVP
ncbi:hypothetical protein PG987_012581 [Apiospora arundinis]